MFYNCDIYRTGFQTDEVIYIFGGANEQISHLFRGASRELTMFVLLISGNLTKLSELKPSFPSSLCLLPGEKNNTIKTDVKL